MKNFFKKSGNMGGAAILFIALLSNVLVVSINIAYAEPTGQFDTYTLLEPLPCINGTDVQSPQGCENGVIKQVDLKSYIFFVVRMAIAIAVFLAVIMIIWGGFEYMTTGAFQGKSAAKKRIYNAVLGLLGILASWLILNTVDPRLTNIDAEIKSLDKLEKTDLTALDADLNRIVGENKAAQAAFDNKIKDNEAKIAELNSLALNSMTEEEKSLYEAKAQALRDEIRQIKSDKYVRGIDAVIDGNIALALNSINEGVDASDEHTPEFFKEKILATQESSLAKLAGANPAAAEQIKVKAALGIEIISEEEAVKKAKGDIDKVRFNEQRGLDSYALDIKSEVNFQIKKINDSYLKAIKEKPQNYEKLSQVEKDNIQKIKSYGDIKIRQAELNK